MIKVLLVDDHTIFRQCIATKIKEHPEYKIIAETGSGIASIELAQQLNPDVIIMDISLPDINGIEASRRIKEKGIGSKIILLSMYKYTEIINHSEDVEIEAYLLKEDTFEDLIYAINAVLQGNRYVSSSLLKHKSKSSACSQSLPSTLSAREQEITELISEGLTTKEIAQRLCISAKTVETHRARIMEKLKVKNVAELIKQAIRLGIIKI